MTHVSAPDFILRPQRDEDVAVPLGALVRAGRNFLTGRFLCVGDNPLADTREQTMNASMHLGLVSALILTTCVPLLMDAVPGEQTNGFMVTDPDWIGSVYFVATLNGAWSLALASCYAIVVLLVMNECSSERWGATWLLVLRMRSVYRSKWPASGGCA